MSLKKLTRSTQARNRTASHTCLLFWALFLFFLRWRGQGWWLQCIFSRCCCCQPNIAVMRQSEGSKKNKIPLLISNSWMPLAGIRTRLRPLSCTVYPQTQLLREMGIQKVQNCRQTCSTSVNTEKGLISLLPFCLLCKNQSCMMSKRGRLTEEAYIWPCTIHS